jgi:hypothetical protein
VGGGWWGGQSALLVGVNGYWERGHEGEGGKDRGGDVYSFVRSFVLSFLALRSKVQHVFLSLMMMHKLCILVSFVC